MYNTPLLILRELSKEREIFQHCIIFVPKNSQQKRLTTVFLMSNKDISAGFGSACLSA